MAAPTFPPITTPRVPPLPNDVDPRSSLGVAWLALIEFAREFDKLRRHVTESSSASGTDHAQTHLVGGSDPLYVPGDPTTIEPDDTADNGAGPAYAYEDHVHPIVTAAASGLANANAEGTATSFARSDHTHKRDLRVAKAGSDVGTRNRLNLIEGTGVTMTVADDAANDEVDVTINAAGGYATVQEEGTPLTQRTTLNFVGGIATAADDAGNTRTNVTLPGYGAVSGLADSNTNGVGTDLARNDHQHKRDVRIAKAGSDVGTRNRINFVDGSGITITVADDAGNDEVDVTVAATANGYATVQEEGTPLTQRTTINFIGGIATAADDAGNTRTNVTLPGYGTISGLANSTGDGASTDLARSDHTHKRDVRVAKAGSDVGTRNRINLIEGTNITLTVTDDAANDEVDITVATGTLTTAGGWTDGGTIVYLETDTDTVGIGTSTESFDGITIGQAADREIGVERRTAGVGRHLTVQAGGGQSGGSNMLGGTLKLSGGIGTGSQGSEVWLMTATGSSSGTVDRTPGRKWYVTSNGHFWPNSSGVYDIGANSPYIRSIYSRGGLTIGYRAETADYTATADDFTITVDATAGNKTVTLPAAASHTSRVYVVKKIDSSVNTVTIDANASETIDGATTVVLSTQYAGKVIQCDGSNWHVIGSF